MVVMAKTWSISKNWFWSTLTYAHRGWPWFERGDTQEIEWPYRRCNSFVVRFPFTRKALVLGKWGPARSETDALLHAVRGDFRSLEQLDVRD